MIAPQEDEIARRAQAFGQRNLRVVQPPDVGATHIADVGETDTSDTRRFCFGISNVDKKALPMRAGHMMLIAARTGKGKTVFAEQMARANGSEHSVLFATFEQPATEIRDSMVARDMGLTLEQAEAEMQANSEAYRAARRRLADMNLHLWHPAAAKRTPQAIMEAARKVKADMIIVDHMRRVRGWKSGNEANAMAEWFSEAAKTTRTVIVLLSQIKPVGGKNSGLRPTDADLSDSTQLPQEASRVIYLHRPFAGHKTLDTVTEIICPKNRFGPLFTTHVSWFGPTRSFYAMDDYEESQVACCKPKTAKKPVPARTPDEMTRDEEDALLEDAFPF